MLENEESVESIREGWNLSTWARELPSEGERIAPKRRAELAQKVASSNDDQLISADELRSFLAAVDRPKTRGARIEGTGPNKGVVYYATVGASGARHLRTVEVEVSGDHPDPRAFRIPTRLIEDLTRYVIAAQEDIAAGDDPNDSVVVEFDRAFDGIPTPEDLRDLVSRGVTAAGIAKRYDRSERRVYQLLQRARVDRPDLNWPQVKRGPKSTNDK